MDPGSETKSAGSGFLQFRKELHHIQVFENNKDIHYSANVADQGCLPRILILAIFRIPDPTRATQQDGGETCPTFFVATNIPKLYIILFLKRLR
jgi:hypothetical protein